MNNQTSIVKLATVTSQVIKQPEFGHEIDAKVLEDVLEVAFSMVSLVAPTTLTIGDGIQLVVVKI